MRVPDRGKRLLPLALLAVAVALVLLVVSSLPTGDAPVEKNEDAPAQKAVDPDDPYAMGIHHARIEVEGYGTIEVTLNANVAPITVANFCHLAEDGFYDGLTFHRVVPGFMIQGGCPLGNGTGGPGWKIKGEFAANGVANPIKHTRGVVSMARAADPNSAGSQFFIMHKDAPHLDGQYAAFGKVVAGMDVVDRIAAVRTDWNDKPATPVRMKSVVLIDE